MEGNEQARRAEKRRLAREKRKRQTVLRLVIAGAVLTAVAVLILAVYLGASQGEDPGTGTTTAVTGTGVPGETGPSTEAPDPGDTVIRIAAAGDVNVSDKIVASGGGSYDYSGMLQDVMPVLARADLTLVNFEGVLTGAPYGASGSAPVQLVKALADSGVDAVQMANSYSIFQGVTGLKTTLSAVKSAGLEPLGAYADNTEYEESGGYTIWEVNGIRVAVVAFTKGMSGYAVPDDSDAHVNVLYTDYATTYTKVDTQGITRLLRRVAAQDPDVTIAMLHWGSENNDHLSASQTTIRNLLLKEGVDAIIGSHPHRVQKIEYDKGEGTLVAYSLGDLVSDGERSGTEYSIVLELEITRNGRTGETSITGYTYTPTFVAEDAATGGVRVLRLESAVSAYEAGYLDRVSQTDYDRMIYGLKRIMERIQGEDE